MVPVLALSSATLVGVAAGLGSRHVIAGSTLMALALVAALTAVLIDATREQSG